MRASPRLLGFAFASADALVELTGEGRAAFAMGAGVTTDDAVSAWIGQSFTDQIEPRARAAWEQALAALKPGARSGPIDIWLGTPSGWMRRAVIHAFILPDLAPSVSCSLSWRGVAVPRQIPETPPVGDAAALLDQAKTALSDRGPGDASLSVAFVNVAGLADASGEQGRRAAARVEATLQAASVTGAATARLTPERYALLTEGEMAAGLAEAVHEAAAAEGVDVRPTSHAAPVDPDQPVSTLRAMRFALESCIRDGGLERPDVAFQQAFKRTVTEAEGFRARVKARDFDLHYQPVVTLDTRAVHHFEALARFGGSGPAPLIGMAEQLGLIDALDLAVAEKALTKMRQPGAGLLKIAVNVSGVSLADDGYVDALLRMTSAAPELRRRLIVEVTETAALADIEAADRRLTALRGAGVKVCIDDFGAGSAGFDYLRRLSVDTVKLDGSLVTGVAEDARGRAVIRTLVELSDSLGLNTIAERIETEAEADAVAALGVVFGQGYLFGRAEAEPRTSVAAPASARRKGAVEAWG